MAGLKTYNPKKVSVTMGSHIASGFAEDSFITIEYSGDGVVAVTGCDGEVVRSIDPSDMYTIKVSVQQTSKTNDFLMKQFEKDKDTGKGGFALSVKDLLGNEQFTAGHCWVTKPASFVRGKTNNNREWELACSEGKFN